MKFTLLFIPYMATVHDIGKRMAGASPENFQTMLHCMKEQAQLAEELGYHGVAWTEQHFQIEGVEVNTNPILYGAYIAQHTKKLKVGQLGIPLTAHNPVKVAEDIALLDHITGGRVFCGFTRGNTRRWFDTFGQHLGITAASSDKSETDLRNREILEESWQIVKNAWTKDTFNYQGKYWNVPPSGTPWAWNPTGLWGQGANSENMLTEIGVVPKPLQKPYPPVYAPFTFSMTTARFWAKEGVNIVSFVDNDDFIETTSNVYYEEARAAGLNPTRGSGVCLGAHLLTQNTTAAADQMFNDFKWIFDTAYTTPPFHVPIGRCFSGTPDKALAHVERLHKRFGVQEIFLWHFVNFFGHEREKEALESFGREVVARFKD